MAFVQVTPDTKSKKNPDAPPKESTNNESMGEDVNGGGWGRGRSGCNSEVRDERVGAGTGSPVRGVELDLMVEEPGDPSAGIGDNEPGEIMLEEREQ